MLWVTADWRRRRRSILLLIGFIGLAGVVALTAVVGARRTATSFERFADRTRPADVLIDVGAVDGEAIQAATELSMVDVWGTYTIVFAIVDGVDSDLAIRAPRDDRAGVDLERSRILRGRLPNPARADEMAVSESAAHIVGVNVGDELSISTMTPEQVREEEYFPALGPQLRVHIVGVLRSTDDLAPGGADGGVFLASEAWLPTVQGKVDEWTTYLGVGLVQGATATQFEAAFERLVPSGQEYEMITFGERSKAVRGTISTLASSLAIFALVAGLAMVVIVGQAVSRHVAMVRVDEEILGQLGFTRAERCAALIVGILPVAFGGAAITALGAWLASPIVPIGLGRRADPEVGRFTDWAALGGGVIAVVMVIVGAAAAHGDVDDTFSSIKSGRTCTVEVGRVDRSRWWGSGAHQRRAARAGPTVARTSSSIRHRRSGRGVGGRVRGVVVLVESRPSVLHARALGVRLGSTFELHIQRRRCGGRRSRRRRSAHRCRALGRWLFFRRRLGHPSLRAGPDQGRGRVLASLGSPAAEPC